jgi:hypothetical protein
VDSDLGAAVPVSEVRPHDEPFAGLAASVAVVCGDGNYGSALPVFDSGRDGARDRYPLRAQCERMANPAAVAGAVIDIADLVGLAWIPAGDKPAGRDAKARPVASEAVAGRDAVGLEIGRESSRKVGGGSTRNVERTAVQPAAGLADGAVPSGSRSGVWFWSKVSGTAHRG